MAKEKEANELLVQVTTKLNLETVERIKQIAIDEQRTASSALRRIILHGLRTLYPDKPVALIRKRAKYAN